jgi:hypothetical protein
LKQIQKTLTDPQFDKVQALRAHRKLLEKDVAHVKELIGTIDKTISSLEGPFTMKAKEIFSGFSPEK